MERPIILKAHEVRGILDGRQTQIRRVIKPIQPRNDGMWPAGRNPIEDCPYGQVGDRLWVQETFTPCDCGADFCNGFVYRADGEPANPNLRWSPSIHMLRDASRITLEITGVRVERLQDISEADAITEGCEAASIEPLCPYDAATAREKYETLWDEINGPESWDANPWVWVISLKRVDAQ